MATENNFSQTPTLAEEMQTDLRGEEVVSNQQKNSLGKYKTHLFIVCCIACVAMETVILAYTTRASKIDGETNVTVNRVRSTVENILLRTLAMPLESRSERSHEAIEVDDLTPFNGTCHHMRMFRLTESDKRITVCTYQGRVRVDMRVWWDDKPSIKGIYFSPREYYALSRLTNTLKDEVRAQEQINNVKNNHVNDSA